MSITVITNEHGSVTLEANDWEVVEGRLWVGTEDVGVAEFSAGSWSYVFEPTNQEPRVWQSQMDIPSGVTVTDKDGELWLPDEISRSFGHFVWGPYTEVVGAK